VFIKFGTEHLAHESSAALVLNQPDAHGAESTSGNIR
jgi:hypothetical protein